MTMYIGYHDDVKLALVLKTSQKASITIAVLNIIIEQEIKRIITLQLA